MKDVLIINLTRMGDLLQTTPVMAGLKEKYPSIRITLLASSTFSEISNHIPFVDRIFSIDINKVLSKLNSNQLIECFYYLEDILNKINDTSYDLTINFTHTSYSALLTSLIETKEIRGLSIDSEGNSIKKHPWIRYFFNIIPGRDYNPFHLCDVYIKAGGVIPKSKGLHLYVQKDTEVWINSLLEKNGVKKKDLLIGIQLGASAEKKRWTVSCFAALADRLVETTSAKIVLTGSENEITLGKDFETFAKTKPINLIGKTNLKKLIVLLKRCNLFISNDTGPLHIATAVGTITINISLASAHFRETGPYGKYHYVITPDVPCSPCSFQTHCQEPICKKMIKHENILKLVEMILKKHPFIDIEDSPFWAGMQVYQSFFNNDELIDYRPLIKRQLTKDTFFRHIYRHTWLNILDGKLEENPEPFCQYLARKFYEWYGCDSIMIADLIRDDLDPLMRLKSLSEIALTKVIHISNEAKKPTPDAGWIKESWKSIPIIDNEIEIIGHTHPSLKPLAILFKYGKEALESKDLAELAEETIILYKELKTHVSILIEILRYLNVHMPNIVSKKGENHTLAHGFPHSQ